MSTPSNEFPAYLTFLHKILTYLPHLAIAVSLCIYAYFIISGRFSSIFNLSLYLIPLIIISLILIFNKKLTCQNPDTPHDFLPSRRFELLYLLLLTGSGISLLIDGRGLVYLLLVGLMYVVILVQIFAKKTHAWWIIAELMVTTALIILPQMLGTWYYSGDGDIMFHTAYAESIAEGGTLATGIGGVYELFCAYHLLISQFSLLTGIGVNASLSIVSTVAVLGTVPLAYVMGRYFTKSSQIGLFAVFFYSLMPMMLSAMLMTAPRVMASMAFVIIFYLVFKCLRFNPVQAVILIVPVGIYMVLVHHAQLLFIAAVAVCLFIGYLLYAKHASLKLVIGAVVGFVALCSVLCVRYWSSLENIITTRLLNQVESGAITDIVIETKPLVSESADGIPSVLNQLLNINYSHTINIISVVTIIIFAFTGIYLLIRLTSAKKHIHYLLPLLLLTFVFFIPNMVDMLPSIADAFQIYRLRILLAFFFAIIMGVGCVALLHASKKPSKVNLHSVLVFVLCLLLIFSGVVTGFSNDKVFYGNEYVTGWEAPSFDESDASMITYITEHVKPGSAELYSDYSHERYFREWPNANLFTSTSYLTRLLFTEDSFAVTHNKNYFIYPHYKFKESGLSMGSGASKYTGNDRKMVRYTAEHASTFEKNMQKHSVIYDNNRDSLYFSA